MTTSSKSREAGPFEYIQKAAFVYRFHGPAAEHNYLCAVCREHSAVLDCNSGILYPCWSCQKEYKLVRRNWLSRLKLTREEKRK